MWSDEQCGARAIIGEACVRVCMRQSEVTATVRIKNVIPLIHSLGVRVRPEPGGGDGLTLPS